MVNAAHSSYGRDLVLFQAGETGEWALLSAHMPGRPPEPIGILLRDPMDGLHVKMRKDWSSFIIDEGDIEIWRAMGEDLEQRAREVKGPGLLDWLEDTASHALQIGARQPVEMSDAQTTVGELYQRYVAFQTSFKCQRNAR